jgi:acetyltransferase-like isoleucine patch superfamily enzyme
MRDLFERRAPVPRSFAAHGEGTWIVPPCEVIGEDSIAIGEAVVILEHSSLRIVAPSPQTAPTLRVGNRVRLGRFLTIVCEVGIELGDDVASSDCVTLVDTWRDTAYPGDGPGGLPPAAPGAITIDQGAYLGYGCTIGPGVHVGEGAFVGEGAVVIDDVAPFTLVYGNPAFVVRRYDAAAASWVGARWP